jgi:hypothetical protein
MKAEGLNPNIIICWDSLTLIPTYNRPRRLVMKAEGLNPNIMICWDSLTLIPTYERSIPIYLILPRFSKPGHLLPSSNLDHNDLPGHNVGRLNIPNQQVSKSIHDERG